MHREEKCSAGPQKSLIGGSGIVTSLELLIPAWMATLGIKNLGSKKTNLEYIRPNAVCF